MRELLCGAAVGLIFVTSFFVGNKMRPDAAGNNPVAEQEHYYEQRAAKDELARLNKQVEQLVAQSDITRAEAIKQKARADALEFLLGTVLPGVKPDAMIPPPVVPFPTKPVD